MAYLDGPTRERMSTCRREGETARTTTKTTCEAVCWKKVQEHGYERRGPHALALLLSMTAETLQLTKSQAQKQQK